MLRERASTGKSGRGRASAWRVFWWTCGTSWRVPWRTRRIRWRVKKRRPLDEPKSRAPKSPARDKKLFGLLVVPQRTGRGPILGPEHGGIRSVAGRGGPSGGSEVERGTP